MDVFMLESAGMTNMDNRCDMYTIDPEQRWSERIPQKFIVLVPCLAALPQILDCSTRFDQMALIPGTA